LATKKKVDPKAAQTVLRQSNVAFTPNCYTQTDNHEFVAAQNRMLDAIFGSEIGPLQELLGETLGEIEWFRET
jgi:hypothetical protein